MMFFSLPKLPGPRRRSVFDAGCQSARNALSLRSEGAVTSKWLYVDQGVKHGGYTKQVDTLPTCCAA